MDEVSRGQRICRQSPLRSTASAHPNWSRMSSTRSRTDSPGSTVLCEDRTVKFISLGNKAHFRTYDRDRPKGMPPIVPFSCLNHPSARDFAKHLPSSPGDSQRLDWRVQGSSFWASPYDNKPPNQTGAIPDRTAAGGNGRGRSISSRQFRHGVTECRPARRRPRLIAQNCLR